MILVTVGSQKFQFNRLLKEIDRLIETGIIKGLLDDLDIITLGPDMFNIHTPDEHLDIESYHRSYKRLIGFLETL